MFKNPLNLFNIIIFVLILNLSKLYMNANVINTQIFHKIKYDLNSDGRSHKAFLAELFRAH